MHQQAINLKAKLALFHDHWSPRVVAEMNNYQFKLVRAHGEFVWHKHDETDETFLVLEGEMVINFRDRSVKLSSGELFVVPKGIEHQPIAQQECQVLIIEPRGVANTGDAGGLLSAPQDVWI
jgi:mannose-6-phosphate isomerase-like protein (cupin superfamily)